MIRLSTPMLAALCCASAAAPSYAAETMHKDFEHWGKRARDIGFQPR